MAEFTMANVCQIFRQTFVMLFSRLQPQPLCQTNQHARSCRRPGSLRGKKPVRFAIVQSDLETLRP